MSQSLFSRMTDETAQMISGGKVHGVDEEAIGTQAEFRLDPGNGNGTGLSGLTDVYGGNSIGRATPSGRGAVYSQTNITQVDNNFQP